MNETAKRRTPSKEFIITVGVIVGGFVLFLVIALPRSGRWRSGGSCHPPLEIILELKNEWARAHNAIPGATIPTNTFLEFAARIDDGRLSDHARSPRFLRCPTPYSRRAQGVLSIGRVGENPTCSIHGDMILRRRIATTRGQTNEVIPVPVILPSNVAAPMPLPN